MLNDSERITSFKEAIQKVVNPGDKVLELGGGTGVLSFLAAQHASHVYYVEQNEELVNIARSILHQNHNGDKVEVIHADASQFLPPEPVNVVICEMLHVGLLREKQASIIHSFKQRYLDKFGKPLPVFVPEACLQAIQLVQHDFSYEGYYAPFALFQDPTLIQDRTAELCDPVIFQEFSYDEEIPMICSMNRNITVSHNGCLNAIRVITKNLLTILVKEKRTVDWFSQYLIIPLEKSLQVSAGNKVSVRFSYPAGAEINSLTSSLEISLED